MTVRPAEISLTTTTEGSKTTNHVPQDLHTTQIVYAYSSSSAIVKIQDVNTTGFAQPSAVISPSSLNATQRNDNTTANIVSFTPNGTSMVPATTTSSSDVSAVKSLFPIASDETDARLGNLAMLEDIFLTFGWIVSNAGRTAGSE